MKALDSNTGKQTPEKIVFREWQYLKHEVCSFVYTSHIYCTKVASVLALAEV